MSRARASASGDRPGRWVPRTPDRTGQAAEVAVELRVVIREGHELLHDLRQVQRALERTVRELPEILEVLVLCSEIDIAVYGVPQNLDLTAINRVKRQLHGDFCELEESELDTLVGRLLRELEAHTRVIPKSRRR